MADIFVIWDKQLEQPIKNNPHASSIAADAALRDHLAKSGSGYRPASDFTILQTPKK